MHANQCLIIGISLDQNELKIKEHSIFSTELGLEKKSPLLVHDE